MRRLAVLVVLAACAAEPAPPDPPAPLDVIWGEAIHPGDTIVAVPGTGGYTLLGAFIDQAAATAPAGTTPVIDWHTNHDLNPIVLEQAIAAAERAGISDADLETGALSLGLWGAGVTRTDRFTYRSLAGLTVSFDVLGGKSICAVGAAPENLLNYTRDSADTDARDLLARLPAGATRISIVSHSWGGAVSEYLVQELARGDPRFQLVVAAGVPGFIVGYAGDGPGLRPVGTASLYEVDRPDDPIHTMHLSWDIEGHEYDIMYGDQFQGSYGITTEELSCHGVPGPCPTN